MAKPEKSFTNGSCKATVFRNEIEQQGKMVSIPKVVISRSYLDKKGQWQTTNSYNVNDLPKLMFIAVRAYDYLTKREPRRD